MPRLQQLWTKFQGHGVQVVAVHVGETEAAAKTWMDGMSVTFPAVQDTPSFTIFDSYSPGYYGVPHLYVIGPDMIIRQDHLGEVDYSTLEGLTLDVVYLRDPIDLAMVMDVSDTMNDPGAGAPPGSDVKLDMMKQATDMITEFLAEHGQADDRMGLVWFTDDVSTYTNVGGDQLMSVQAYEAELRAAIAAHTTGVCTAMGAGLQTGFNLVAGGTGGKFAILCTDGMQNVQPMVAPVGGHYEIYDAPGMYECGGHSSVPPCPGDDIHGYNTRVHTIGVGVSATYAALLQDIANATDGFYKGTNDPDVDLDLIYFTDLCNCMAGASPVVVMHHAGHLPHDACVAVERFRVNATVRKVAVFVCWPHNSQSDLFFWLRAPNGVLVDLHHAMMLEDTYAFASLYLPVEQDGVTLPRVGTWTIDIRGETGAAGAPYHAFVIAEDRDFHFHVDFPRRLYAVGEIIPIHCEFAAAQEKVVVRDVKVETARLRTTLPELLGRYSISDYELRQRMRTASGKIPTDPLQRKIAALAEDPRYREALRPVRATTSLATGDLACSLTERGVHIPIKATHPGMTTYKLEVLAETPKGGPLQRTEVISVFVDAGKVDPKRSTLNVLEATVKGGPGRVVRFTPRNAEGQLFGPGYGGEFQVLVGAKKHVAEVEDLLDGSYRVEFASPKAAAKAEAPTVTFRGHPIWTAT